MDSGFRIPHTAVHSIRYRSCFFIQGWGSVLLGPSRCSPDVLYFSVVGFFIFYQNSTYLPANAALDADRGNSSSGAAVHIKSRTGCAAWSAWSACPPHLNASSRLHAPRMHRWVASTPQSLSPTRKSFGPRKGMHFACDCHAGTSFDEPGGS